MTYYDHAVAMNLKLNRWQNPHVDDNAMIRNRNRYGSFRPAHLKTKGLASSWVLLAVAAVVGGAGIAVAFSIAKGLV